MRVYIITINELNVLPIFQNYTKKAVGGGDALRLFEKAFYISKYLFNKNVLY